MIVGRRPAVPVASRPSSGARIFFVRILFLIGCGGLLPRFVPTSASRRCNFSAYT